jgi:hypothetical protein
MSTCRQILCPCCGFEGHIPNSYLGKKIRCRLCGTVFTSAKAEPTGPPTPALKTVLRKHALAESAVRVFLGIPRSSRTAVLDQRSCATDSRQ